jgi:hypothetical protein
MPGLAVPRELVGRTQQRRVLADLREPDVLHQFLGHLLPVAFLQFGLRIEEIQVRRAARLEQVDDVLCLGREMRSDRRQTGSGRRRRRQRLVVQERGQRQRTHAGGALAKESAPGGLTNVFESGIHKVVQPLVRVSSRLKSTLATIIQAATVRTSFASGPSVAPTCTSVRAAAGSP